MNDIDVMVGKRIKARRLSLRMTQTQLADGIGVTFQQVQKYENGSNRVSAARLWAIADIFKVPVSFFFDDLTRADGDTSQARFLADDSAIELAELYAQLNDAQKQAVLSFLRSITDGVSETAA